MKSDTKWGLYNSGYINIKDVPLDTKMSSNQRIQVDCEINQTNLFNKKKKSKLNGIKIPAILIVVAKAENKLSNKMFFHDSLSINLKK